MDQPLHDLRPFKVAHAPAHRFVSFGLVAALHVFAIYALATGLVQGLLSKLPTELKADVIPPKQEVVKPPPPPPPELQKPPPPFVPPPEINIQTETASPNTITVQSKVASPPVQQPAPPKPAGITAPVQIAGGGAVCQGSYYPPIAIRLNQSGTTTVTVHIAADGSVSNVDIAQSSGHDSLDQASIKCITNRWRYKPALQNGQPVAVTKQYAMKWVLQ